MLVFDEDAKVSTVTSLSDLRIRGQRSKRKVKLNTLSNDKVNSVDVLSLNKHAKVPTVTSSDTWIRVRSQWKHQTCNFKISTPNLPRALERGTGSSSFFLSGNTHFSHTSQHPILTKFGSKWPVTWPLLRHKRWWGQRSRRGHRGQKRGQKRVNFHQKHYSSYRLRSIDMWLMHVH